MCKGCLHIWFYTGKCAATGVAIQRWQWVLSSHSMYSGFGRWSKGNLFVRPLWKACDAGEKVGKTKMYKKYRNKAAVDQNDKLHAMYISIITKLIFENTLKNLKLTPITVKKIESSKDFKSPSFFNGKRSSQPKYHIPRWKTVIGSLKYFFLLVLYK